MVDKDKNKHEVDHQNEHDDFKFDEDDFDFEQNHNEKHDENHNEELKDPEEPAPEVSKTNLLLNLFIILLVLFGLYKVWGLFSAKRTTAAPRQTGVRIVPDKLQKVTAQPNLSENNLLSVDDNNSKSNKDTESTQATQDSSKIMHRVMDAGHKMLLGSAPESDVNIKNQVNYPPKPISAANVNSADNIKEPIVMRERNYTDGQAADADRVIDLRISKIEQKIEDLSKLLVQEKIDINAVRASSVPASDLKKVLEGLSKYIVNVSNTVDRLSQDVNKQNINIIKLQSEIKSNTTVSGKIIVDAIIPGRAWLRDGSGQLLTVSEGDELPGYGRVIDIDARVGLVRTELKTFHVDNS